MATVVLSGNDSITLDGRIFADFADGMVAQLTYNNDLMAMKTGKNGNTLISENKTGENGDLVLRVLRGSPDDKFLNGRLSQQLNNFPGFVAISGQLTKFLGDGKGKITEDTYVLSFGTFLKPVEGKSNVEGDTEQSVSIYTIRFASARRSIG